MRKISVFAVAGAVIATMGGLDHQCACRPPRQECRRRFLSHKQSCG
jgi:hypothetical protein